LCFNGVAADFHATKWHRIGHLKVHLRRRRRHDCRVAPSVDSSEAIAMYTDAGGAIYKGLGDCAK